VYNIILDHVSVSWSLDENMSVFRNVPAEQPQAWATYPRIHGVTIQRCLVAEGLHPHSTGIQVGGERVMKDGKSIYNGGHGVSDISIHRNLFATCSHRNPGLGCQSARVINNVMYNWSSKCAETHDAIALDWIGNYLKPGPLSDARRLIVHNDFFKGFPQHRFGAPSVYMAGNVNAADARQGDWDMYSIHYEDRPLPPAYRRDKPMPEGPHPVKALSAQEAYASVLADVGANARLNERGEWVSNADAVDLRVLEDVRRGRGLGVLRNGNRVHYAHPDDVGGYPTIEPGTPYEDSDRDGMADTWERKHGLNPKSPSDSMGDDDGDGYTNVEEFLNGTDPKQSSRHSNP